MEPSGKQKKDTAAEYLAVNCFSWGVNAQKKKRQPLAIGIIQIKKSLISQI